MAADPTAEPILVTGATGFLGTAVVAHLRARGRVVHLLDGVDLCDAALAHESLQPHAGRDVVHLAYPGGDGIGDALSRPATIAADLLRMDLNVIEACAEIGVRKLVCIGSVCAYPETTRLPTDESQLWAGYPEPVNASYGIVKRTQLALLQAFRQEFDLNGIHLILPNLYGPGDRTQHVIPALIRRMRAAKRDGTPLTVWGHPDVTRSFLYVDDAAAGIGRALEHYDRPEPLNLVNSVETSMATLVRLLAQFLDFRGEVVYDPTKPAGHRRRWFSTTRLCDELDWIPPTHIARGLATTVQWHLIQEQI